MKFGIFKKTAAVLSAAALALCLFGCESKKIPQTASGSVSAADTSAEETGNFRADMTSAKFAEEMGIGLNLGNTLDAYWADLKNKTAGAAKIGDNDPSDYEACWGSKPITKEMVDGIKAEGFSTVRIPVYWGNMMKDDGEFRISSKYLNRVGEVINCCLDNGLYAVVNIHHYDEFIIKNYPQNEALEIFKKLWTQIAERYKDYSDYVIFEGFNENLGTTREEDKYSEDEIYSYVNALNQTFVDAVRATGGNNAQRLLIASGYWTNIDKTTDARFIMPKDSANDRLMVSVHYVDNAMYWTNKIGSEEWLNYATAQCELLKKAFTDKGIQVFVGECTGIYEGERFSKKAVYTESSTCLGIMMDMIKDYGFIPVIWDVGKDFYSRVNCRLSNDSDRAVIVGFSANAAA